MEATFYDADGKFTGTFFSTAEAGFQATVEGRDYIESFEDSDTHYYDRENDTVVSRPVMTVSVEGYTLTGLPVPCQVLINGETYDVDDGVFEYVSPLPVGYDVTVTAFPWQNWTGRIGEPDDESISQP